MAAADLVALCTRISLIRKPIVVDVVALYICGELLLCQLRGSTAAAGMTFIDSVIMELMSASQSVVDPPKFRVCVGFCLAVSLSFVTEWHATASYQDKNLTPQSPLTVSIS